MQTKPEGGRFSQLKQELRTPGDVWLAARMAGWSLSLPLLKYAMPLERLVRLMAQERARGSMPGETMRILRLAWWTSRLQVWRFPDNCLERSLVAYRFLGRAGEHPRVVMGIRRTHSGVEGHAWVELDGKPALESQQVIKDFEPVVEFGTGGVESEKASSSYLWRDRPAGSAVREGGGHH